MNPMLASVSGVWGNHRMLSRQEHQQVQIRTGGLMEFRGGPLGRTMLHVVSLLFTHGVTYSSCVFIHHL